MVAGYDLYSRLGEGGMGEVWKGRHSESGTDVAIKIIRSELVDRDPEVAATLEREVHAMAKLRHPNIVGVLGFKRDEFDQPFIVMECADATLSHLRFAPSWTRLRRVVLDVLEGLKCAHARGIIHRDIKPPNILLFDTLEGITARITDFGVAQAVLRGFSRKDSAERSIISAGTLTYMPPEQLLGEWRDYGPWTDLYALACMTWEIVCGSPPFVGDNVMQLTYRHLTELPGDFDPKITVPDGLEGWLRRALAKAPSDRFQSAAHATNDLLRLPPVEESTPSIFELDESPTNFFSHLAPTVIERTEYPTSPVEYIEDLVHDPGMARVSPLRPPTTWKTPNYSPPLVAGGLGLFELSETRLYGFDEEREIIWSALHEAHDSALRICLLKGRAAGAITDWIGIGAHESGITNISRVSHGQSTPDSLAALAEEVLAAWALDEEELESRLRNRLTVGGVLEEIDGKAATLQELLFHGGSERTSQTEKIMVLAQTICELSRKTTHVVLVENAQYATSVLELIQRMGESMTDARVLFVLEERDVEPHVEWAARRDLLLELDCAVEMSVEPDLQSRRETIEGMLSLSSETVSTLVSGTRDSFEARQLLAHWIETESLTFSDMSFSAVDPVVPRDQRELWDLRVQQAEGDADEKTRIAWRVAAILGDTPRFDEWRLACHLVGVDPDESTLTPLLRRSLIRRQITGFTFSRTAIRESILESPSSEADSSSLQSACADALLRLHPSHDGEMTMRIVHHLSRCGRQAEAIPLLFASARTHGTRAEEKQVTELLEIRRELMDEIGMPDDARERVQESWLYFEHARDDSVDLDGAIQLARDHQYEEELAYCLRVKARSLRGLKVEQALEYLRESDAIFQRVGNPRGLFSNRLTMTYLELEKADLESARREAEAARQLASQTPSLHWRRAAALVALMSVEYEAGELEKARDLGQKALERARQHQDRYSEGAAFVNLGEVARARGAFEEALEHYQHSRRIDIIQGTRAHNVTDINIATTLLGLERGKEALELFSKLHRDRDPWMAGYTLAGLFASRAVIEDFDTAREHLEELRSLDDFHLDEHLNWLLERGERAFDRNPSQTDAALVSKRLDELKAGGLSPQVPVH